uniref:Uncharacterized protein n=1 Tax=Sphaerodactylus townsendi TaxID=933632 RepID=A0ACB8EEM7_9SAUR
MVVYLTRDLHKTHGCGEPTYAPLGRVVNGQDSVPYSWPWQISLQYESNGQFYHTCGGSLIAPNWVMTAGHCISSSRRYKVVLGEYDRSKEEGSEQHIPVNSGDIFVHPGWNNNCVSCGDDIALLKLSHEAVLNDKVQLGCLPPRGELLPNDHPCFISGWGRLYTGGPLPSILQQALLPVVDHAHCTQPTWWGSTVKETMVCAGGDIRAGCNGDSGGPLNCQAGDGRWYVHGVTSFVSAWGCNTLKKPTVFTRVSAFNSWIEEEQTPHRLQCWNDGCVTVNLDKMLVLLIPIWLVAGASGCGQPIYAPNARVVNGEDANPFSWPWQISLQYEKDGVFRHTCGGSLIAPNWVMTAAHCISNSRRYEVVLGEYDMDQEDGSEQRIPVNSDDIFVHPRWLSFCAPCGNDIALLKLSRSAELNDKVELACLPPAGEVLPNDYPCYISGWGRLYRPRVCRHSLRDFSQQPKCPVLTGFAFGEIRHPQKRTLVEPSAGGPLPSRLQQAVLPVVDHAHCTQPDWWGALAIRETMVCAGGDIRAGCNGDSGGPLNCQAADGRWQVHGIASFVSGLGCNALKKPTVFTRVSAFDDWIQETMAGHL